MCIKLEQREALVVPGSERGPGRSITGTAAARVRGARSTTMETGKYISGLRHLAPAADILCSGPCRLERIYRDSRCGSIDDALDRGDLLLERLRQRRTVSRR